MRKATVKEAAQEWVRGFNAIPQALIEKAYMNNDIDGISELTPLVVGDVVWSNDLQGTYEVIEIDREERLVYLDSEEADEEGYDIYEVAKEEYTYLPMWGTMWTFGDSADDYWVEELDGLAIMAECGFRVYETDELGYVFGIDGAGYDFYEAHWIPLYKRRFRHEQR